MRRPSPPPAPGLLSSSSSINPASTTASGHSACAALRHASAGLPCFKPLCLALLLAWQGPALALPQGGVVGSGAGAISSVGNAMQIQQNSPKLVIDWQRFGVGSGESVRFQQPSASSMVLNRVAGQDPSRILGTLQANGQVFITNPNGIVFGPQAQVNVGGLAASTGLLSNDDFNAGNFHFNGNGSGATILNQGTLTASKRGYIALLAPQVINEGVINARLGTALLAAGDQVTLHIADGSPLGYNIGRGAIDALAANRQLVKADGGQVFMSARAADQLGRAVVNNDGVVEALNVEKQAGVIKLLGDMQRGSITGHGRLDASAPHGGDGGAIETSAAHVKLDPSALVTAAAPAGKAGAWLIDPTDYLLDFNAVTQDGSGKTVLKALESTDVTISTAGPGTDAGTITVNGQFSWGNGRTLTLRADTDIVLTPNTVMSMEKQSAVGLDYSHGNLVLKAAAGGTGKGTFSMGAGAKIDVGRFGPAGVPNSSEGNVTLYYTPANFAAPEVFGRDRIDARSLTTWLMVANAEQLQAMGSSAAALKSNFALAADIDASGTRQWNQNAGFAPVGDSKVAFSGNFDGMGHTVSNLYINRPRSTEGVGLFGQTQGGVISNVGLIDADITGGTAATGALAGFSGSTIVDSYASGQAGNSWQGSKVTGSGNGADGAAGTAATGGLVGSNRGAILRSYSDAAVNGARYAGGLVGKNLGRVELSYSTGAVSGTENVGGFAGGNESRGGSTASISNVYSTGAVHGSTNVGGLVGENAGDIANAYSQSAGVSVEGQPAGKAGGLIGQQLGGQLSGSLFWDIESAGVDNGCACAQAVGTGLRSASMMIGLHGLDEASWLVYDFRTAPLLRNFLKPLTATFRDGAFKYNGLYASATPYIAFSDSNAVLGQNLFGVHLDDFLSEQGEYVRGRDVGAYTFRPELYSNQKGYAIQTPASGSLKVYIDPRTIYLTPTAVGKEYDGTTASNDPAARVTADYLGQGDTLVASQSYDNPNANKDASDIRTLKVDDGYRVMWNDTDVSRNYDIRNNTVSTRDDASVVIKPKAVTIAPVYDSREYDATDGSQTVTMKLAGSDVLQAEQSFASANVGHWQLTFKKGYQLTGEANNYQISIADAQEPKNQVFGDIRPKTLRAHAVSDYKIYDGTKDSNGVVAYQAGDLVAGQKVVFAKQAFVSENADPRAELQVTGLLVNDGNNGLNYKVVNDLPVVNGVQGKVYGGIAQALLKISAGLSDAEQAGIDNDGTNKAGRFYDGTTTAAGTATVEGLITAHGDRIQTWQYLDAADAGQRKVEVGGEIIDGKGGVSRNYRVEIVTAPYQVFRRPTTIQAGADSKVYDRTDLAGNGKPVAGNAAPRQTLVGSQRFADVNAAPEVATVVNEGYYFIDQDGKRVAADNYLIQPADVLEGKGSITPREVSATAQYWRKKYDGSTASAQQARVDGVIDGDVVGALQEFDGADHGARQLKPTVLVEQDGRHNYVLGAREETAGFIDQRVLTIAANPFSKTYDGNTGSAGGVHLEGDGLVGQDSLHATAAFQTADALPQQIEVGNDAFVKDGNGARSGNYLIGTRSAPGSILKKQLDVIANGFNKPADGIAFAGGNGVHYSGFVNNETPAVLAGNLAYRGSSQGAVAPGRYDITPDGLTAKNYALNNVSGTLVIGSALTGIPGEPGNPDNPGTACTPLAPCPPGSGPAPATALPLARVIDIAQLDAQDNGRAGKSGMTVDLMASGRRSADDGDDERTRLEVDSANRNLDLRVVRKGMRLPPGLE
ncbi:MAG: YDG domain-containing protein [Janthinobacterium lividum]